MARTFDGVNGKAQSGVSATTWNGTNGTAITVAAIARSTTDATRKVIAGGGTSSNIVTWELFLDTSNRIGIRLRGVDLVQTLTMTAADGWCLVAASKASGTVAPRYHKTVLSSRTATHEADAQTSADHGTADAQVCLGMRINTTTTNPFAGQIAVVGAWQEALTDATIESLAYSLAPWFRPNCKGLWVLDQQATTGKTVNLIGTLGTLTDFGGTSVSTVSVPEWNRGIGVR